MNALPDLLRPGLPVALVLVALRVGGLLLVAPMWSAKTVPMRLRTAALVLFAVLLLPTAIADRDLATLALTPATFLGETLVGFALGFAAAVVIAGAEAAGEMMTISIGLSGAALLDPSSNQQTMVLGSFTKLMALTLLLVGGGHVLMLQALAATFDVLPLGGAFDLPAGMRAMLPVGTTIFAAALQFAGPVIAAIMLTNVALGVMSRAAPSLNILSVAFPLQIAVGLFTLAATVGLIVTAFRDWPDRYTALLDPVLRAFGATVR